MRAAPLSECAARIKPSSMAADATPFSSSISPACSTQTCSSASIRKRSKSEKSSRPLLMHSGRGQGDLAEEVVIVQQVKNAGIIVEAAAQPLGSQRSRFLRKVIGCDADADDRVNGHGPQAPGRFLKNQHARSSGLVLGYVK